MKRKVALFFVFVIVCTILVACTSTGSPNFRFKYNEENYTCTIKNVAGMNYTEFKATIVVVDKNVFKKEFTEDVGDYDKNATIKIELNEDLKKAEIKDVYLDEYSYDDDSGLIAIFIILLIVLVVFFVCMILA